MTPLPRRLTLKEWTRQADALRSYKKACRNTKGAERKAICITPSSRTKKLRQTRTDGEYGKPCLKMALPRWRVAEEIQRPIALNNSANHLSQASLSAKDYGQRPQGCAEELPRAGFYRLDGDRPATVECRRPWSQPKSARCLAHAFLSTPSVALPAA